MSLQQLLIEELEAISRDGLYKDERVITTPQDSSIRVMGGEEVLNFCANNYLGLANHPDIIAAAKAALDDHGFGMASVRFICGTQDLHKSLERSIAAFFGTEDAILYSSCFDANGGLFETLLGPEDAVISDALNHASIIDGVRLCKARRYRYAHADMGDLQKQLQESSDARCRLIATDGVFSMDGDIAPLDDIVELAARFDALVMVDDSHATGFVGPTVRMTSTSSLRHSAKPWGAHPAASPPPAVKWSIYCVSGRGPTYFPTAYHRPWWPPASRCSVCCPDRVRCAINSWPTPGTSVSR
jgi:glycine C-acetyltransferase